MSIVVNAETSLMLSIPLRKDNIHYALNVDIGRKN